MRQTRWHKEKRARSLHFARFTYGWVREQCSACSGSGHYDHNGSPACGGCEGTGYDVVPGLKALRHKEFVSLLPNTAAWEDAILAWLHERDHKKTRVEGNPPAQTTEKSP